MALRHSVISALLACACLCVLLEPTPADDSFFSSQYTQEVLRKAELEIFSKMTPLQPLDYLMIYVMELKLGMNFLNDTVSGIGRQYHDLLKKEMERVDQVSSNQQCSCNDSVSDEERDLHVKMDAIQADVQRVLEHLRNVNAATVTYEPLTTPGQVTPSENKTDVRQPGPEETEVRPSTEESEVNDAVRNFKANNWKHVKESLSNVLDKTSPAFQQLQSIGPQDTTPLNTIVVKGFKELLEELLDRGLPVSTMADETWHYDMMVVAAISGNVAMVELLLRHGASVETANNRGVTPLMFAAAKNHLDVVKALVRHGADVNRKNIDEYTALDYARKRRNQEIVEYLLSIASNHP